MVIIIFMGDDLERPEHEGLDHKGFEPPYRVHDRELTRNASILGLVGVVAPLAILVAMYSCNSCSDFRDNEMSSRDQIEKPEEGDNQLSYVLEKDFEK